MIVGELCFKTSESNQRLWCDRLAVDVAGSLLAASVTGCNTQVAAFCALLHERDVAAEIRADDIDGIAPDGTKVTSIDHLWRCSAGYRIQRARLAKETFQAVAVSRDAAFLPCASEEAIWSILASDRFTTPILKDWTTWLIRQFRRELLLTTCTNFNMDAATFNLTGDDLDTLVSKGVASGKLHIA